MKSLFWFLVGFAIMTLIGIGSARAAWCTNLAAASGGYQAVLVIAGAAQSTQAQLDACTTPILVSQSEYYALTAQSELWGLTPSQGAQIASVILLIWGIAFVYRLLFKALSIGDNSIERNEP